MNCQESVCLGGAMLASVAVGVHRNLESAAQAMVHEKESIRADQSLAQQYALQLANYRQLHSALVHSHNGETQDPGEEQ
jgi:ribulose kinase